jgi:adenylylsulfate kinase
MSNPSNAICFWLTGLSGSGKTTISKRICESTEIVHLDGDLLRKTVCNDLGFSKEDRHENLRRAIGIARLLVEQNFSVICSFISPYEKDRVIAKESIPNCKIVYLETSIDVCKDRDPKGLYKKALAGEIPDFTGISAPFETPVDYDLKIDTHSLSLEECAEKILKLKKS